jgi:diguanylate cyclase (GGDEF)-like protein/PAS domain S-box-containing protein
MATVRVLTTLRQQLLVLVSVVFSLYLVLLLSHAYRSQSQLVAEAEARLIAESRQTADLIRDVLVEQVNFVSDLAELHQIESFLVNKALGVSMRYGLNINLSAIEEAFSRKLGQRLALGEPVYDRIVYFDEHGARLVDTHPGMPSDPRIDVAIQDAGLIIDDEHGHLIAFAPVRHRDQARGLVLTVSRFDLLARYLASPRQGLGFHQLLITPSGGVFTEGGLMLANLDVSEILAEIRPTVFIPIEELTALMGSLGVVDSDLALRVPVGQTGFSVLTLLPKSILSGHITSRSFLYFASAVPPILLVATFGILSMHQRTQRLKADIVASNRDRADLRNRNDLLTDEIARREALEAQLRESEARYRTYVEHAPEGIFVSDAQGLLVDVNPSACRMVGYSRAELLGMAFTDLAVASGSRQQAAGLGEVRAGGLHPFEMRLRRKDGSEMVGSLHRIALPGRRVMGFCVDVTERKVAEMRIYRLAYFDPLTGLPNRLLLHDRLNQLMAGSCRSREHGVLMLLDLDHFKDLNDTQGHDVGDRLLVEVAHRLAAINRREDTVARLGGDEYVVVASKLGSDEAIAAQKAQQIAEKLHRSLDPPIELAEGRAGYQCSTSIGVTLFRCWDFTIETLLRQADVALYQAKSSGRNAIRFFDPLMQAEIDARTALAAALRRATASDEMRLYYQPQVDREGRVIGAEVLLRWLPGDSESISPERFIPVAEDTGLIVPLGLWVLHQACLQLRAWQADLGTRQLKISINVSARQFHQPDFVDRVRQTISEVGVDARGLVFELTESVVLDRIDQVITRMQDLQKLGLGFSLDDFGTGYSSLSYLKRLPLAQVKIDKSFVRELVEDQNDAAIVRSVLAMSHSLGLTAVAEGVETDAQWAFLLDQGCEQFQGYLFGRPAPIEDFPFRLPRHRPSDPDQPCLAAPR